MCTYRKERVYRIRPFSNKDEHQYFRQQWENQKRALEAKQPMDVQMLQGQKRELTMQLDREQAEKQELFMQVLFFTFSFSRNSFFL